MSHLSWIQYILKLLVYTSTMCVSNIILTFLNNLALLVKFISVINEFFEHRVVFAYMKKCFSVM